MAERDSDGRFVSKPDDAEVASDEVEMIDISDTVAPSVGPHTMMAKHAEVHGHEQSDLDAMGLEKRRQVVGGQYSASLTRQIVTYAIVVAVIVGAGIGLKALADNLDQPPAKVADQAPWTGSDQKPAKLQ